MNQFRRLFGLLRPYKRSLIAAAVLTAGLTFVGMAPPLLMRRLVNDVAREGRWGIFALVMGLLFGVPLLRALVNIVNSLILNRVGLRLIRETRRGIFAHLMRLSMRFYDETPVGGIQQRLMGDVGNISGLVTGGMVTLLADVVAVGFAVVVMLRLSGWLSLLTFGLLPLYFLNYRFFSKRIQSANAVLRSRMDHISSMLQERLSAHELIQSYGQEKAEATRFSSQAKQIMDAAVKGQAYSISFSQLAEFINKMGNTLIYCAGCYLFVKERMNYGDVIAFAAYATQLLGPVVRFAALATQVAQVGVSVDRVNEILDREPAIREAPDAAPVTQLKGDVAIDGLTFGYGEAAPVIDDLNLDIAAGAHVAVLGPPGAGCTTLAMLLRRFYDPRRGTIAVDGRDIRRYCLKDYRRGLALIAPSSAIFDGTIRGNLCYGQPDASAERMIEVAKAVGLHPFVAGLAEGYDTRLGTGGLRLSAGVQQQIRVARALVADPFILIADEAAAALDPESADTVNLAIRDLMHGRTCILIVHQVIRAREADSIAVIRDGRIIETGTHDDLMTRPDGAYRRLYDERDGGPEPGHGGEA